MRSRSPGEAACLGFQQLCTFRGLSSDVVATYLHISTASFFQEQEFLLDQSGLQPVPASGAFSATSIISRILPMAGTVRLAFITCTQALPYRVLLGKVAHVLFRLNLSGSGGRELSHEHSRPHQMATAAG